MQQRGEEKKQLKAAFADSDDAVFDLLEALLHEVDEHHDIPLATVNTEITVAEALPETRVQIKNSEQGPIEEAIAPERVKQAVDAEPGDRLPEWTKYPQQCLLFEVEDTEIAIPLVVLNSIAVWDQEALPIPAQPDWHLGVIQHRGDNVVILDTARLIMPENVTQTADERRLNHGSHFLVVNHRWALSCNAIKETIQLKPEQVKWRPLRPTRRWAVGTLIDRLCVLLDTEALIREIGQD